MINSWFRRLATMLPRTNPARAQHRALLGRYQQLRQVALRLNNSLVESLPRKTVDDGGRKLGLLHRNVLTLNTEDEIAVLMDHCLYDLRPKGKNAIEQFLIQSAPPAGS